MDEEATGEEPPAVKIPIPAGYQFDLATMGPRPVIEDVEGSRYFLILHADGVVTWAKEAKK